MPLDIYIIAFKAIFMLLTSSCAFFVIGLYFYLITRLHKTQPSKAIKFFSYFAIGFGIFLIPVVCRTNYTDIFSRRNPDGSGTIEAGIVFLTWAYFISFDVAVSLSMWFD